MRNRSVMRCGRHAVRGELIRHVHQYGLARILSLGAAGRFCHHLRERQTAGLVVQRLRNGYAVPAGW